MTTTDLPPERLHEALADLTSFLLDMARAYLSGRGIQVTDDALQDLVQVRDRRKSLRVIPCIEAP